MREGLYPLLLGPRWADLDPPVQALHAGGPRSHAHADLTVERGANPLTRFIAWVMRFPPAGVRAMSLSVERDERRERWSRSFDGHALVSDQWAHGPLLCERVGLTELCFALRTEGGALIFEQRSAHLRLGPLRLPLPGPLAPQTSARVEAHGALARIDICVRLAFGMLLLRYAGLIVAGER